MDKSRINEFGFSAEMEDKMKEGANDGMGQLQENPTQRDKKRD